MKRFLYICAEVLTLYVIMLALGGGVLLLAHNFSRDLRELMFVGYAIVAFFAAIKFVLIGDRRSLWTGFYNPSRPLAIALPGVAAFRNESELPGFGFRRTFSFVFSGERDLESFDVVSALSDHLRKLSVRHAHAGGLRVEDNGATWWIEPVLGERRLDGWVESPSNEYREQIISGIRDFLEQDLKLQVA